MEYSKASHTKTSLSVHIVWVTKYRYKVLEREPQNRCRDLMRQDCDALEIRILKGEVGKDHMHLHIEYPPKLSMRVMLK
jgi:putative transposase